MDGVAQLAAGMELHQFIEHAEKGGERPCPCRWAKRAGYSRRGRCAARASCAGVGSPYGPRTNAKADGAAEISAGMKVENRRRLAWSVAFNLRSWFSISTALPAEDGRRAASPNRSAHLVLSCRRLTIVFPELGAFHLAFPPLERLGLFCVRLHEGLNGLTQLRRALGAEATQRLSR